MIKTFGWCPISKKGKLWVNWMKCYKHLVIDELNLQFAGWKEEGFSVVRVEIKEVSQRIKKRGGRDE